MIKRKDKILISALELLGEEGSAGITIKNLAKRQEVSEPALYRQFKSKQEILNQLIEEFKSYDSSIENTILHNEITGKEAILFYINRYAELYENYYELTTVLLSMDLYFYHEHTNTEMKKLLLKRKDFLTQLISNSREQLSFKTSLGPVDIAELILGTMMYQVHQWRMSQMSYALKDRLNEYIMNLL